MKKIVRVCCMLLSLLCLSACSSSGLSTGNNGGFTIQQRKFSQARAEFSMVFHVSDSQFENSTGMTVSSIFRGAFLVEPKDTGYTVTLPELQVSIVAGDASLDFHSGNTYTGEAAIRALPFKALTDGTFTATPTEQGSLESLGGFQDVLEQIRTDTAPYGTQITEQATAALNEFLNENTLCYLLEKLLFSIPEGTMRVGDTKERHFDGLAPYSYSMKDIITYTGRSGNADVFAIDGVVSSLSSAQADSLLALGLPYYEMSGTTAGTCTVFTEGELLRSGSSSGNATGICYFPDKKPENGAQVAISRQMTYSVKIVE
ncbi:MAG: hypothetical protein IKU26_00590 [Clostridia bacterium]|nr:hypothetical protein [Clostridia bacterium]